jgi:acyl-coenzyme A synthetase/AMP-(fatty) acid ligase
MNLYAELPKEALSKTAVIFDGVSYSYASFFERIDSFAASICSRSAEPADRVGVSGLSRLDCLAAMYACAKTGTVYVPISTDPQRAEAASRAADIRLRIEGTAKHSHGHVEPASCPEAMIIFTSGTTSSSRKGVIVGHDNISSTARFMNERMQVDGDIRECVFAPVDHAFAIGRCHAVLVAGGTLLLGTDKLGVESLFDAFLKHGANALSAPPSVLVTLLGTSPERFRSAARLRWLQTGAMRFDPTFRESLCRMFPETGIFTHYGLSEAMRATFLDVQGSPEKIHTEGRAADGVEIGIFNERRERLPAGADGIIGIKGRNVCLGYVDTEQWRTTYEDGWFFTSDRGLLDEDGYLVFLGRADDAVNVNGFIVHPDEIESRLAPLFPTQAFSVVGVPDPAGLKDSIVVLCIEGAVSVSPDQIRSALDGAEKFMVPKNIIAMQQLPRTHTGKVMRAQLSRMVYVQLRARST